MKTTAARESSIITPGVEGRAFIVNPGTRVVIARDRRIGNIVSRCGIDESAIDVLCTVYCVLCTVYDVLCNVYCVLCAVYCVRWTVTWCVMKCCVIHSTSNYCHTNIKPYACQAMHGLYLKCVNHIKLYIYMSLSWYLLDIILSGRFILIL